MKLHHKVTKVSFSKDKLSLEIDGKKFEFLLAQISNRLSNASPVELENFKISPSGYGIHWNLIDEDLSIDGLLKTAKSKQPTSRRVKV